LPESLEKHITQYKEELEKINELIKGKVILEKLKVYLKDENYSI